MVTGWVSTVALASAKLEGAAWQVASKARIVRQAAYTSCRIRIYRAMLGLLRSSHSE